MFNPRRFVRSLIVYTALAAVTESILISVLRLENTSLLLFFVPAWIAAMQEGRTYAATTKSAPQRSSVWRSARVMAEIYLTLSVVLTLVLALFLPDVRAMLGSINLMALLVIIGLFTLIALIAIRWGYSLGVRLELKQKANNSG